MEILDGSFTVQLRFLGLLLLICRKEQRQVTKTRCRQLSLKTPPKMPTHGSGRFFALPDLTHCPETGKGG
jgi:hypothetical protein